MQNLILKVEVSPVCTVEANSHNTGQHKQRKNKHEQQITSQFSGQQEVRFFFAALCCTK